MKNIPIVSTNAKATAYDNKPIASQTFVRSATHEKSLNAAKIAQICIGKAHTMKS
jgi:hypothetical protein